MKWRSSLNCLLALWPFWKATSEFWLQNVYDGWFYQAPFIQSSWSAGPNPGFSQCIWLNLIPFVLQKEITTIPSDQWHHKYCLLGQKCSQPAPDVIIQYCALGSLGNRNLFLTVLESGKSQLNVLAYLVPWPGPSCWLTDGHILPVASCGKERESSGVFFL